MIPARTKVLLTVLLCTLNFAGGHYLGYRAGVKDGADKMFKAATLVIQQLQKRCGPAARPGPAPHFSQDGKVVDL